MKKRPAPQIDLLEGAQTAILIFRWDDDVDGRALHEFHMYDDQALRMARDIIDTLEGRDHDLNH